MQTNDTHNEDLNMIRDTMAGTLEFVPLSQVLSCPGGSVFIYRNVLTGEDMKISITVYQPSMAAKVFDSLLKTSRNRLKNLFK